MMQYITHCISLMIGIFLGTRLNADKTDLSEILPEEVEEEVKAAAEISMGTEVLQLIINFIYTVEAPISGHTREAKKVSATGADLIGECVNREFV